MLMSLYSLYAAAFLFFVYRRARILMLFFQQEEYNNSRFIKHIIRNPNLIDRKISVSLLILLSTTLVNNSLILQISLLSAILLISGCLQYNPLKNSKKPLLITSRVKRLFEMSFIFTTILVLLFLNIINNSNFVLLTNQTSITAYILSIILIQAIPLIMILTNILLWPVEKLIQIKYLKEAKAKLAKYNPTIIAITGSYGKTSTKHILENILGTVAPTLATPGSINTPMGITRIIREKLKPEHKFFIVEMGAYGKGSIARLCDLTPPDFGIITAIGNAHFERFKTIENVAQAKFELSQAIAKNKKGFLVVNAAQIKQELIEKYCVAPTITINNKENNKSANYLISQIEQNVDGLIFKINLENAAYNINASLYGIHHVENIALCFALAHQLKVPVKTITAILKLTPQIQHRLEVTKEKAKPIIIDDAYNANPSGFTSALELLKTFKENGYRSIIVTPGIVELGTLHHEKHFALGEKTAQIVDFALVVIPERIQAFIDGFNAKATKEQKLLTFKTFKEAKKWLDLNAQSNDVILFENDLPDLYESKINF